MKRWLRLAETIPGCICNGHPLFDATKELQTNDGSLTMVARLGQDCLRHLRRNTNKDLHGARYLIFRSYKFQMGSFGGRRLWAARIFISTNKTNPGLNTTPVAWCTGDELNSLASAIKNIMDGRGNVICDDHIGYSATHTPANSRYAHN